MCVTCGQFHDSSVPCHGKSFAQALQSGEQLGLQGDTDEEEEGDGEVCPVGTAGTPAPDQGSTGQPSGHGATGLVKCDGSEQRMAGVELPLQAPQADSSAAGASAGESAAASSVDGSGLENSYHVVRRRARKNKARDMLSPPGVKAKMKTADRGTGSNVRVGDTEPEVFALGPDLGRSVGWGRKGLVDAANDVGGGGDVVVGAEGGGGDSAGGGKVAEVIAGRQGGGEMEMVEGGGGNGESGGEGIGGGVVQLG